MEMKTEDSIMEPGELELGELDGVSAGYPCWGVPLGFCVSLYVGAIQAGFAITQSLMKS